MSEEGKNEEVINIMLLGNNSVGKTCFILRYADNIFNDVYLATGGIDFKVKYITLKEQQYKLIIYDTTGEEKYRSIALNVIKTAQGIILMYDITNKESFDSIPDWIRSIKEAKGDNFPMILCGNKVDNIDKRQISEKEGGELADKYKIKFFETSNKEGINIDEAVLSIVNKILIKRKKDNSDLDIVSDKKSSKLDRSAISVKKDNSEGCC